MRTLALVLIALTIASSASAECIKFDTNGMTQDEINRIPAIIHNLEALDGRNVHIQDNTPSGVVCIDGSYSKIWNTKQLKSRMNELDEITRLGNLEDKRKENEQIEDDLVVVGMTKEQVEAIKRLIKK